MSSSDLLEASGGAVFLTQASRQQHHVMCVMRAGPASHITWSLLVKHNLPALTEQRADVRRAHIVDRIEPVGVRLVDVDDLDERVAGIAERGIEPTKQETYDNGVRKVVYRDPDGNEVGFGAAASVS